MKFEYCRMNFCQAAVSPASMARTRRSSLSRNIFMIPIIPNNACGMQSARAMFKSGPHWTESIFRCDQLHAALLFRRSRLDGTPAAITAPAGALLTIFPLFLIIRAGSVHRGDDMEYAEIGIIGGSGFYDLEGLEDAHTVQAEHPVRGAFGKAHAGQAARPLGGLPVPARPRPSPQPFRSQLPGQPLRHEEC